MNLGNPNWQRYWAEETCAKFWSGKPSFGEGADGIFADNSGYRMPWRGQWHLEGEPDKPYHASVFFEGWPRNYAYTLCPPQPPKVFDVDAEGRVNQQESLRGTLYAGDTLAVEFPVDGSLTVHVPERSAQGDPILEVQVDGAKVLTESLPRDTETAWSYWKFFTVPVLAGAHRIRVSNTGSGTFWAAYELGNYRLREGPDRKGRRSLAGSSARRLLTSFADPMMGPVWLDSGQQKIVKLDGHGTAPVK